LAQLVGVVTDTVGNKKLLKSSCERQAPVSIAGAFCLQNNKNSLLYKN